MMCTDAGIPNGWNRAVSSRVVQCVGRLRTYKFALGAAADLTRDEDPPALPVLLTATLGAMLCAMLGAGLYEGMKPAGGAVVETESWERRAAEEAAAER